MWHICLGYFLVLGLGDWDTEPQRENKFLVLPLGNRPCVREEAEPDFPGARPGSARTLQVVPNGASALPTERPTCVREPSPRCCRHTGDRLDHRGQVCWCVRGCVSVHLCVVSGWVCFSVDKRN
jgi:hypothetical protein